MNTMFRYSPLIVIICELSLSVLKMPIICLMGDSNALVTLGSPWKLSSDTCFLAALLMNQLEMLLLLSLEQCF